MLGRDLVRAAELTNHEVTATTRAELDVTDRASVDRVVERARPDAVINCAAYTDVDGAEREPEAALRVNADGARNVAAAAVAAGASVLYVSTDYVFDGRKGGPYVESDEPNPLSSYGASKLAGEVDTSAVNPQHYIVRSSWLFGTAGRNFAATMLDLGARESQVVVVRDQVAAPTYTAHLAEGLVRLVDTGAFGLYHMAAGGQCSWYDFAVAIFEQAGVDCRVLSTTTEELGRPAPRPEYSALATQYADAIHLPDWTEGLDDYLAERR
ncbi:MAG: dTDP-4-dehydrorhamnose reductase [Thermoleophilaceae bacterium]|jgi:dTDP-4-dehydrorhamnose reductase|nr:dTDP-4-dehydrorhamnose reductase [Thermoleophilaceae bacterium]